MSEQIASVETILAEIELDTKPRLLVFNKTDLLEPAIADNLCQLHNAYGVSALERGSLRPLLRAIEARLWHSQTGGQDEY